jgi:hypothetical protein
MRPADVVGAAIMVAKIATGEIADSVRPVAKRGKGGKKPAKKRSSGQCSRITRKPPEARWGVSRLPLEKRVQVLSMLIEGSPMHMVSRACDVAINSVSKLLADAGRVCAKFHDERVQGVRSKRISCSEIWSFRSEVKNAGGAKATRAGADDVWTWTALDVDSKLIVSWVVGGRDADAAKFIEDLLSRLANGVGLTRSGFIGARSTSVRKKRERKQVLTSSTLARKLDNYRHGLALYFFWHNWCRINKATGVSPVISAGLTDKPMNIADIANMIEAAVPKRGPRHRQETNAKRAARGHLAALARIEAAELNRIKSIIRKVWTLPSDLLPERLSRFADELRTRIKAGQTRERLYLRAGFVQVHDMKLPLSPAHRTLVDRVYALLKRKSSN